MGENTCKWNNLQGVNNIQNTQIAHTTQYIKKKTTQLRHEKMWIDSFNNAGQYAPEKIL